MEHLVTNRETSAAPRSSAATENDFPIRPGLQPAALAAGPAPTKIRTLVGDLSLIALSIPFLAIVGGILLTALQPVFLLVLAMLLPALAPLFALLFIFLFLQDRAQHVESRT